MGFEQQHTSPQEDGDTPAKKLYYTKSIPTDFERSVVAQNKEKVSEFASKVTPLIKQIEEKALGDIIGLYFEGTGIDIRYYEGQEIEVTVSEEGEAEWVLSVEQSTNTAYIEKYGGVNVSTSQTDKASVLELDQALVDVLRLLEGLAAAENVR